jgi:hypothetical protein
MCIETGSVKDWHLWLVAGFLLEMCSLTSDFDNGVNACFMVELSLCIMRFLMTGNRGMQSDDS